MRDQLGPRDNVDGSLRDEGLARGRGTMWMPGDLRVCGGAAGVRDNVDAWRLEGAWGGCWSEGQCGCMET